MFHIDDADLACFMIYAQRELSLNASLAAAEKYGRGEEHKKSIRALRELNLKMLFRESKFTPIDFSRFKHHALVPPWAWHDKR